MHELIAAHYSGVGWETKHAELTKEFNKLFEEEKVIYGNLPDECDRLMKGYILRWRKEDRKIKQVIMVEEALEAPLPHGHTLAFTPDRVVEDDWGTWLVETKTHKKIPTGEYRFLDVQTARYFYGLLKKGIKVTGILWDYVRTRPPTVPRLTKTGLVKGLARMDTELYTFVSGIKNLGLNPNDFTDKIRQLKRSEDYFRRVRTPKPLPVVKQLVREAVVTADAIERGVQPVRSIDRSCEWQCAYRDLCISDLYGGNTESLIKLKFHVREEGEYGYDEEKEET